MGSPSSFPLGKNFRFSVNKELLVFYFNLGSTVFWQEHFVTSFYVDRHHLTLFVHFSWTGGNNRSRLNFGLSLFGQNNASFGHCLRDEPFHNDSVQQGNQSLSNRCLSKGTTDEIVNFSLNYSPFQRSIGLDEMVGQNTVAMVSARLEDVMHEHMCLLDYLLASPAHSSSAHTHTRCCHLWMAGNFENTSPLLDSDLVCPCSSVKIRAKI